MTNNNENKIIPKEIQSIPVGKLNKKKYETIQEVNNEIPTYEEFMKNYNGERVNYEDLNSGDIGTIESYGPGNEQSKQTAAKVATGVVLTGITAVCPPAGAMVGASIATSGAGMAITGAVSGEDDMVDTGIQMIGMGATAP